MNTLELKPCFCCYGNDNFSPCNQEVSDTDVGFSLKCIHFMQSQPKFCISDLDTKQLSMMASQWSVYKMAFQKYVHVNSCSVSMYQQLLFELR